MYTYVKQFEALGDPTRRALHERLLNGPSAVGELARDFPMSRPAISQHLSVLKRALLVSDRAVGARRIYAVNPKAIEALGECFHQFWIEALAAFKEGIERSRQDK